MIPWRRDDRQRDGLQPDAAGLVSIAIGARSGDVLIFDSRESGAATAPQLVVTYQ